MNIMTIKNLKQYNYYHAYLRYLSLSPKWGGPKRDTKDERKQVMKDLKNYEENQKKKKETLSGDG